MCPFVSASLQTVWCGCRIHRRLMEPAIHTEMIVIFKWQQYALDKRNNNIF